MSPSFRSKTFIKMNVYRKNLKTIRVLDENLKVTKIGVIFQFSKVSLKFMIIVVFLLFFNSKDSIVIKEQF